MKTRIIIVTICCLMAVLGIIGMIQSESMTEGPEYVFTYAENQPDDYPTTLGAYRFAELVEERTAGRIKVIVKAGGELGDEYSVVQQLEFGGIDFTRVSLSSIADDLPKLSVLQMPFLYRDSEHMWKVLDGEIGEELLEVFDDTDLMALSWYDAGARNFYNSVKPIQSVEDMEGMRIRVQEYSLMVDVVEALRATAVPLVYSDVYSALERGTIDGAENNWPSYETTGHYEIAKYYTVDEHSRVPEVQLCAQSTWDKLSEEDREIISQCAKESALYERQLWKEREKASEELVLQKGVQVTTLTYEQREEFRKAVDSVYESYCGEYMDIVERIRLTE